jgi:hypothetical protein
MDIYEVELGDYKSAYIYPISDMHIGDDNFNVDKFLSYRKWILDNDNAFCFLNGDILNTATKNSKSDVYTSLSPQDELNKAIELLSPLANKGKILCSLSGNHEARIQRESGIDIAEILASRLGIYYAGDEVLLKIKLGHKDDMKPFVYTLYATHGSGGGRSTGAKANALHRLGDIVLADCYVMSHIHSLIAHQDVYAVPDIRTNKVNLVKRTFTSSGAYLQRGGYTVSHAYTHAKLGSPRIRLEGRTHKDIHVSL